MNTDSKIVAGCAFVLSLISFVFFAVHVMLARFEATYPLLLIAVGIPPVLLSLFAAFCGWRKLFKDKRADGNGLAIANAFSGTLGLIFWLILVPMIAHFAVPAVQEDSKNPKLELSQQNMRVLIRHVKTFHQELGRMPVKIDELVDKDYVPMQALYDPRDRLQDMPSYRIVNPVPSNSATWAETVALEGRWPDAEGRRLLGYWDERISATEPNL